MQFVMERKMMLEIKQGVETSPDARAARERVDQGEEVVPGGTLAMPRSADGGRVLVAYGSKFGATAEIVEAIGKAPGSAGLKVDVEPASDVRSLDTYRAMVKKTPPELRDQRRAIDAWARGIAAALTR